MSGERQNGNPEEKMLSCVDAYSAVCLGETVDRGGKEHGDKQADKENEK